MSFKIARPSSPSDNMLSPCSKSLLGVKKNVRKPLRPKGDYPDRFTLEVQVFPHQCPAGDMRLILGTASSCRRAVMEALGWQYEQIVANIDGMPSNLSFVTAALFITNRVCIITEKAIRDEDPIEMPVLIAKAKADTLIKRHNLYAVKEPAILITSDQIVLHKSVVREKPESRQEAVEFLASYSNDAVSTVSAIVVTHLPSGLQESGIDIATVYWKEIPDDVVQRVVDKGETLHSAGGFLVEDPDLNPLIKDMDKPIDSVMGLPVALTERLIVQVLEAADLRDDAASEGKYAHK